ncbi:hypothetical protein SMSP2_02134 [Limihaloglobus sulfuriphilus]|uniref:DUF5009 domain-containing protein n=1 Tax=Limihaloglobus sulfuriphilus TaxID=1851148 RepID=A0A1R7T5T8_9BACT|nr:DUF5009 domain-containing protein [Limihaloglobus sulfuriphilus]AQQ71756.1 hypothetical protein SMSP2_02134 [Limihaloglobus sulfuriphilus]
MDKDLVTSPAKRAYSLDMLRGIAILLMILSGLEPFGSLPSWMYHAQTPPPSHQFDPNLPGITWVDLVFPFFIFSMGAAIPLSLGRRLKSGQSVFSLSIATLRRFAWLLGFAIFAKNINPFSISGEPTAGIWLVCMLMFGLMFAIWGRWPWNMPAGARTGIKTAGIIAACSILYFITYKDGKGFSVYRSNIILHVLANLVLFGGLIWLFTRNHPMLRLGVMALVLAIGLSASAENSWLKTAGSHYELTFIKPYLTEKLRFLYDLSWIIQWRFLKYLFIIIPATIIGENISDWLSSKTEKEDTAWAPFRYIMLLVLSLCIVFVTVAGLKARYVFVTFAAASVLSLLVYLTVRKPLNSDERLIEVMSRWAPFWLVLGFLLEPYQGGIKKDPSTLSYYFICTALAIYCIIIFTVLLQRYNLTKYFKVLIYNGQNPMIAYISTPNVLHPLLGLFGLRAALLDFYSSHPLPGFVLAVVLTAAVAVFVSVFSKKKIYLRT